MKTVEYLGQEWCNPENIDLMGSGYITTGTPEGLMVLCAKEKYRRFGTNKKLETIYEQGTRYRPLKWEDLNIADGE